MSNATLFDLTQELQELKQIKHDLLANTTELERKRLTPQLIALSKQITALTKTCLDYEIKSGVVMQRDEAAETIQAVIGTVMQSLSELPIYDDWEKRLINVSGTPEVVNLFREFVAGYPDKYQLVDDLHARIMALVTSVKDAKPEAAN